MMQQPRRGVLAAVLWLQVMSLPVSLAAEKSSRPLNIAYIYSSGGDYVSNGTIPAVQLAAELISNSTTVLPGYDLVLHEGNSECDRHTSLLEFFRLIPNDPPKVALLGSGCSVATEPVAEISSFWNITHLSYASSSGALSDRSRFPNLWRTYPSEDNLAEAVVAIVNQYGWRQLKIITEEESLFISTTTQIKEGLNKTGVFVDENGVTIFTSRENVANMNMEEVFSPEIRIYLLNMYSTHARRLMCAAARARPSDSYYYPGYVWITLGWYEQEWWTSTVAQDSEVDCEDQEFEGLLQRTLAVRQIPTAEDEDMETNVNLTARQFRDMYMDRLDQTNLTFDVTATLAYDALWAFALAADSALQSDPSLSQSLDNFTYSSTATDVQIAITNKLNISFMGVSGEVVFDSNGTRVATPSRILKYRDSSVVNNCGEAGPASIERIAVGVVNSSRLMYLRCEGDNITWPDGVPPDGTPEEVIRTIVLPLFIIYVVLVTCGISFAIVCLLFNFIFRDRKIIKLISPNLNYLIILGAIMIYLAVIVFVIPTKDATQATIYCHLRAWLQNIGYYFCFGTIVAKMWRVYYIFNNPSAKRKKKPPQDWHLFLIVLSLTALPAIVLTAAAIFDDYEAQEIEDKELSSTRNDDKVEVEYYVLSCNGNSSILWIILLYAYLLFTQVAAVFFAFRTRKVQIKALNDSKQLSLITYITSVIVTVMIIGAVSLADFINADAALFGAGLMIFTTVVLGLVFIPKMVILRKDPHGEHIFVRRDSTHHQSFSASLSDAERERMMELEKHCRDLEGRLSKHEYVERLKSFRRPSLKVRTKSNETITTSIRSPIHSLSTTRPPFAPTQLPDPPTTPDQPLESIEPSTPSHSDDGKNRCSSGSERGQANVGPVDITSEV